MKRRKWKEQKYTYIWYFPPETVSLYEKLHQLDYWTHSAHLYLPTSVHSCFSFVLATCTNSGQKQALPSRAQGGWVDVRRRGGEEREKLSVRLPPVGTGETARVMWIVQTMDLLQPYTPLSLSSSASKHCALPPFPSNFSPLLPHPHPSPLTPSPHTPCYFEIRV